MYIQSSWKVSELLHVVLHDTSAAPARQKHAWKFLIPPHSTCTVVTADTYTSRESPQNLYGPSSGLVGGCSWKSPVGWQPQGGSQAHGSFCSGEETVLQLSPCFNSLSDGPWRQHPQGCTKGTDYYLVIQQGGHGTFSALAEGRFKKSTVSNLQDAARTERG